MINWFIVTLLADTLSCYLRSVLASYLRNEKHRPCNRQHALSHGVICPSHRGTAAGPSPNGRGGALEKDEATPASFSFKAPDFLPAAKGTACANHGCIVMTMRRGPHPSDLAFFLTRLRTNEVNQRGMRQNSQKSQRLLWLCLLGV